MKIQKQQGDFHSKKTFGKFLNQVFFKHQVQKEIEKIKKIRNRLLCNLQQLDNRIVVYQDLFLQEKQKDYKSADEIVEYFCANIQMAELTVEEITDKVMDDIDERANSSTIDQILSKKENIDIQEEPRILDQLTVGDLIEGKINQMYS